MSSASRSVALVTLGCARNEVDSEELAGRLGAGGWTISDGDDADVVVINTCGFIDSAKKDSIDTVLAAADSGKKVVAVGCLAERYGAELAASLPEADAVLGFDSYADIAARLDDVAAGRPVAPHRPRDRRTLLPLTPAHRPAAVAEVAVPGHAWLPSGAARTRLDDAPMAYLKLASGCDRRCSFCAIPSFRGAFVSRPPAEILAEAQWLADSGARELVLVSENSTSYGKDLGDLRALERLLPDLAAVDGVERIRVSYLQPAELRPSLLEALATTPGVAPYFDLSFQHASPAVLRRMKRFGSTEAFLDLLAQARALVPEAGARSNVIVGFPGESEDDVAELERFLTEARLDVVGVFGYSDEDGTDAAQFDGKLDAEEIAARVERVTTLADELIAQRAEDRIGTRVEVIIEHSGDEVIGRAVHQGPDVDGTTTVLGDASLRRGQIVAADVGATVGVDLIADARRPAMVKQPGAVSEDPIADPPSDVSAWNIANALTVFRLLLVPVFVLVLFHGGGHLDGWRVAAWGVFAVASITDRFDGDIARKRGLVTEFGKLADPIADKALIGAALVGLSALDDLAWWITVVILVREVGVTLLRFWVIRHGVIAASRGGKVKTLLQAVAIGLYVLPLTGWLHDIATVIMYAAIVVTLVSGVDYVGRAIRLRRVGRTERATV